MCHRRFRHAGLAIRGLFQPTLCSDQADRVKGILFDDCDLRASFRVFAEQSRTRV